MFKLGTSWTDVWFDVITPAQGTELFFKVQWALEVLKENNILLHYLCPRPLVFYHWVHQWDKTVPSRYHSRLLCQSDVLNVPEQVSTALQHWTEEADSCFCTNLKQSMSHYVRKLPENIKKFFYHWHGSHTFSNTKFKDFLRTFQGLLNIYQGPFLCMLKKWFDDHTNKFRPRG